MKKRYVDKWGQIWVRISADTVYKRDTGYGGWFGGAGLEPYDDPSI